MTPTSQLGEDIARAFAEPTGGVVGVVDDLLKIGREVDLEMTGDGDRVLVRIRGGSGDERFRLDLPRNALRAVIARVAALCNEASPGVCSPYGGGGQVTTRDVPPARCSASFRNAAGEQWLRIGPAGSMP